MYLLAGGSLEVRSSTTGTVVWSATDPTGAILIGGPMLTDDWVFVATSRYTFAYNRATHQRVQVATRGGKLSMDQRGIYVVDTEGVHHFKWVTYR